MKTTIKLILVLLLAATFASAQDLEAIFNRGLENLKAEKYQACISDFKSYIAKRPEVPQAHYNLGICYADLNKHLDAIDAYREAVRLKPDYYNAYVQLGNELDYAKQYNDAVVAYNKAIKLDPNNPSAYTELGVAQNSAGNYALAAASYKKAIELDPENISANYGLGLVAYNLKNKSSLKRQLDILRGLDQEKADKLQDYYDKLPGTATVKKPVVKKTAQRIKDEKDVAAMQDFGFDGALVTGVASIRETASKTGKVLLSVKRNDILSLTDKFDENGFYRVVDEKSGIEGYIDGNAVVIKLTGNTENTGPSLNDDGVSESVAANPVVSITNSETKTTLKIRLNGTLYLIPPQTTKVVSVSAGKFNYYGWSPGIRPAKGTSTLQKGRKYSWNFKIYRR
jgi:cytochrome c-type biogenesis protein CcmH/NrfG